MIRIFVLLCICLGISQKLFSMKSKIAENHGLPPTLLGFSHPQISSHHRSDLSLRNFTSMSAALEVLELAGRQLETCTIQQNKKYVGVNSDHRQFGIICHGLEVFEAAIHHHRLQSGRFLTKGFLPMVDLDFVTDAVLLSESQVREQMIFKFTGPAKLVYFFHRQDRLMIPSYHFRQTTDNGLLDVVVSALDGEQLYQDLKNFHIKQAYVFGENPDAGPEQLQELTTILSNQANLNGPNFTIYGSSKSADRATSVNDQFSYDPSEEKLFDQVQTYYNLERASSFFTEYFKEAAERPIEVYTHTEIENNAMYIPGDTDEPDRITIGSNDNLFMVNLNRDSDVVIHEYSHHIIYRYLQSTAGESLILHEGTSDFFAYVINDNNDLAESLLPNQDYLRTANLDSNRRFDDEKTYNSAHLLGQFWSGVLWQIYQNLNDDGLKIIANSLNFWSKGEDTDGALLALILSDQALFEGNNRCHILRAANNYGFDDAALQIDTENTCKGIDYQRPSLPGGGRDDSKLLSCGSIGNSGGGAFWFSLFLPIGLMFWKRRREA